MQVVPAVARWGLARLGAAARRMRMLVGGIGVRVAMMRHGLGPFMEDSGVDGQLRPGAALEDFVGREGAVQGDSL
ncbi:MAG: hypothetical protein B7Y93_07010 [Micrococcales bacterium 32-70-13]|nr:MAG: hypothetical protein B7Y93_07010 [Micrococcales bacterium 32-70-13]